MKKKPNIVKDALILFVITILSGLLLGGLHALTKDPIAEAEKKAKDEAYSKVLTAAVSFEQWDTADKLLDDTAEIFAAATNNMNFSLEGVSIDSALKGVDKDGNIVGYVVLADSSKSYGGNLSLVVGMDTETNVKGISVLSINDTPGLGMKAKDEGFDQRYIDQDTPYYIVVKHEKTSVEEVQAISSATITSKAYTGAVNGAKAFLRAALAEEGGRDE